MKVRPLPFGAHDPFTCQTVAVHAVGSHQATPTQRGDGVPADQASIFDSQELGFDRFGNLFFSDFQWSTIRRLGTDGVVTTVAGNRNARQAGDGGRRLW